MSALPYRVGIHTTVDQSCRQGARAQLLRFVCVNEGSVVVVAAVVALAIVLPPLLLSRSSKFGVRVRRPSRVGYISEYTRHVPWEYYPFQRNFQDKGAVLMGKQHGIPLDLLTLFPKVKALSGAHMILAINDNLSIGTSATITIFFSVVVLCYLRLAANQINILSLDDTFARYFPINILYRHQCQQHYEHC